MKNWLKASLIFLIVGLSVYSNSFHNKFLMDDFCFLRNPVLSQSKFSLSQWNPYREQALGVLDQQETPGYYRPLAHMVLDYYYAAFKNDLWKYHFLNLILLVVACTLVYVLLVKLTGNHDLAFLTGLFYLVHPLNGIVVNYISACVLILQVIFMLGAVLLLWRSLERKKERTWYYLSVLLCFLSLFWHESAIMTPLYISVAVFFFRTETNGEKIRCLIPYFIVIFFYLIFRPLLQVSNGNIFNKMVLSHMTGWAYPAVMFKIYAWYISKWFYPQGIVMGWGAPYVQKHLLINGLGLCSLIMVFGVLFVRFNKEKVLQMAVFWVLIGFAPVLVASITRSYSDAVIEPHWFIFSSIGFFIFAAHCFLIVLGRTKQVGFVLLLILIFSWGMISHAYNQLWKDQKTYALYWYSQDPGLKSTYTYIGYAYEIEGDLKNAKKFYRMALSGHPLDQVIYINLCYINQAEGHYQEAESDCHEALKFNPNSADAYENLGYVYFAEGELDVAKNYFNRALMLNLFSVDARRGLAYISLKHSDYRQAIELCHKNLAIINNDPKTLELLREINKLRK